MINGDQKGSPTENFRRREHFFKPICTYLLLAWISESLKIAPVW